MTLMGMTSNTPAAGTILPLPCQDNIPAPFFAGDMRTGQRDVCRGAGTGRGVNRYGTYDAGGWQGIRE